MSGGAARFFDSMAGDYDVLEPWYTHLYATLDEILREALSPRGGSGTAAPRPRALDAGCGTGFQAARLAELGYAVQGVDLAMRLLAVARRQGRVPSPVAADLVALPFAGASFEVVTCCGSTLSLVDDAAAALGELARVLAPGGRLLLEVEHRPSLDLYWALASAIAGDLLGYGLSAGQAMGPIVASRRSECWIPYPGYPPLRLFGGAELRALLEKASLSPSRSWGLHAATGLLPSTVLHRASLPRGLATVFGALRRIDRALAPSAPSRALANSLVILATRAASSSPR
jgi:SAM-dependent methyltransferase